jgi:hypothetical protein
MTRGRRITKEHNKENINGFEIVAISVFTIIYVGGALNNRRSTVTFILV